MKMLINDEEKTQMYRKLTAMNISIASVNSHLKVRWDR